MSSINFHENLNGAVNKVIQYIEDAIVNHKIRAGSKLPTEQELCEIIGVSRSGVREAMKILAASRIVTIRRGDGTYISDPDEIRFSSPMIFKILLRDTTLTEMSRFREVIEMAVLMLAIQNSNSEDMAKLREVNDQFCALLNNNPDDYTEQSKIDIKFHATLADIAGNSIMRDVYLFIFEIFEPFIIKIFNNRKGGWAVYETHAKIIEAIERKDFLQIGVAVKDSIELWVDWLTGDSQSKSVTATELLL